MDAAAAAAARLLARLAVLEVAVRVVAAVAAAATATAATVAVEVVAPEAVTVASSKTRPSFRRSFPYHRPALDKAVACHCLCSRHNTRCSPMSVGPRYTTTAAQALSSR